MAYNANIPQPNDRLKDSQPQILANFQALGQLATSGVEFIEFPNGTVFMWEGAKDLPLGGNNTIAFPTGVGIPTFSAIYAILVTPEASVPVPDYAVTLKSHTMIDMVIYASRRTTIDPATMGKCNYLVIGLKA